MSTVQILIVEDNPSNSLELQILVDELGYDVLAAVDNSEDTFKVLKSNTPDIIFMDIQIKGSMNGLELAENIQKENIPIIFITSHVDKSTFNQAKEIKNFGYLVKPFNHLTLENMIEVALINSQKGIDTNNNTDTKWDEDLILKDYVFIKKKNRLDKVALDEIQYLQADGNYCTIHTLKNKYILKMSLKRANEILSAQNFLRVNKGNILNMKCISSIELSDNLIIIGSDYFPIGKRYKEKVIKQLRLMT